MEEEVNLIIEDSGERMESPVEHLKSELSKIRAGKASASMLESVMVDYYGAPTPISQVANLSAPDPRTIMVQPWERSVISAIEKGIINSNLGFNPSNDGNIIRVPVPPLTEERRKNLVKQVKGEGENARVSARNIRRDAIEDIKKLKKDGLAEDACKDAELKIQKITDDAIKKIDELVKKREEDIMTI
jgi:ribosome recycling factor